MPHRSISAPKENTPMYFMVPTFKPLKAGLFEREKVEAGSNGIWGGRSSAYLCWDFGAVACHLSGKM